MKYSFFWLDLFGSSKVILFESNLLLHVKTDFHSRLFVQADRGNPLNFIDMCYLQTSIDQIIVCLASTFWFFKK